MTVASKLVKNGLKLVYQLDKSHISPGDLQRQVLQQLLKKAQHTDFGTHYGFSSMLDSANFEQAFRSRVPIFDYNQIYDQWWHKTLQGASNVCWKGRVKYFALSSGTTGASSKYIPVTIDMMRAMRQVALRMFSCLPSYDLSPDIYAKEWLMIGGSASLEDMGHAYAGDLSGINARKPPIWVRKYYRPGTQIAKLKNWDQRVAAITEQAHKWDIGVIVGIPSWVQLTLESVVNHYKLNNIHEIWPSLEVYVSGGIAFEPYRKSFERLLAKPLVYQDSYLASEGFVAYQSRPQAAGMKLALNSGIYFEFIPFTEENFDEDGVIKQDPSILTLDEVNEHTDYALVISTCAGAWRYKIGDTVRFTDRERAEIQITGRTKQFLSLCGEHLSVDNMNQAILEVEKQLNVSIKEFAVVPEKTDHHFAHHWYIGCDEPANHQSVLDILDQTLMRLNDDYKVERSAMLRPPVVHLHPSQLFYDWQRSSGKLNGQSKIPRVMRGSQAEDWKAFLAVNYPN
ncbi:MAG: GH3 auxin-responsive promoter family protein [Saprospiraceae bacterium]|jgi:hypothetical protein|nr:GH3 auxin-responsive promoter family protein [Saprospiraceae bacterium]MDP4998238.1 GH3 auxin-responsive promoter family protein [Saprospiraceae bacterium]